MKGSGETPEYLIHSQVRTSEGAIRPSKPKSGLIWNNSSVIARVQSQRFWFGLFVASLIVAMVGYGLYIARYGENVIFWDEWSWTPLFHASHLTLSSFWVQHNEDRIFFPTLIAAALINSTNWNDFTFFYAGAAFMFITLLLVVRVFWDDIVRSPGWWIPLPFLVLTLAQYQNTLWAFQLAWSIVMVALVGALVLLLELRPSMLRMGLAIVLGIVASYSSLQGLLVWPAGLVILASRGQTRRSVILWSAAAIVAIPLYFVGFSYAASGSSSLRQVLANLPTVTRGLLISLGSVIPTITAGISGDRLSEVIGALFLIASVATALAWWRERRPAGPKAFCVALIVLTLAFDVLLVPGRIIGSVTAGTSSRYATFNWPMVVGIYAYAVLRARDARYYPVPARFFRDVLALLVVAQIVVASYVGVEAGRVTRTVRNTTADILANYSGAPLSLAAPYVLPPCVVSPSPSYCSGMSAGIRKVEKAGVNVFSDRKALASYRLLGIVPSGAAAVPLPIPAALRREVGSGADERKAWNVLSAVYASDPAVRAAFPVAHGGTPALVAWAASVGRSITRADIVENEWAVPLGDAFFLQQYASTYQAWTEILRNGSTN